MEGERGSGIVIFHQLICNCLASRLLCVSFPYYILYFYYQYVTHKILHVA